MMPTSSPPPLDRATAHRLLKQFDCPNDRDGWVDLERSQVREAIRLVSQASDYQLLGICADNLSQGIQALQQYTDALGYTVNTPLAPVEGAVYIKFNPKIGQLYASPYLGQHRGVLVSCQSAYADGLNEMYGHLPLDLFASEA